MDSLKWSCMPFTELHPHFVQIGPLDVLVNNAGFYNVGEWDSFTDDDWQQYWDVNVMSGIRLSRAFLKQMLERNSGNIVFISSEAGIRTIPQMVPYSVSKSAQLSVARGLAANTKGTKVRVNSVLPGPTLSEGVVGVHQATVRQVETEKFNLPRSATVTREKEELGSFWSNALLESSALTSKKPVGIPITAFEELFQRIVTAGNLGGLVARDVESCTPGCATGGPPPTPTGWNAQPALY
eukprot:TRINITY_DN64113_c0_g1_i4.p1 TRINITY_DN64113_c0_g1~~TRINITY_DN64113_c0_g1_i4.p1  ORF type:complete len:239 (-),score=37.18 TRINITY_DN64113_c0_g1_i4:115-831(-)